MKIRGTGFGCLVVLAFWIAAILYAIFAGTGGYDPPPAEWHPSRKNYWIEAQDKARERGDAPKTRFRKRSPEPDREWYIMNEDED